MFKVNDKEIKTTPLCQSLFFNKVAGLRTASLLTRDSGTVTSF